ncbi:MAG: glycosyltransferase family 4 protein [Desulfomonilia bacterium]
MNILIYTTNSTYTGRTVGGAETSLRLIAEGLAKKGHSIVYLTLDETLPFGYRTKIINDVTVIFHSSFRNLNSLKESRGIHIDEIENDWLRTLFSEIIIIHDIHLVHTFYELDALKLFIDIRARLKSFVIVMRMAGLYWYEHVRRDRTALHDYSVVFGAIDSVNFISAGLQELTAMKERELGCSFRFRHSFVGDIGVIPATDRRWGGWTGEETMRMITATRFSSYQKRQDLIIEAARLLRGKIPFHLKLIGSGATTERFRRKIAAYGLDDSIEMVPYLKQDELWSEMQHAHLLCHPCDYEGLSKIVMESMSMGLPVLCSDVLAPSSYIEDGLNGYLVDNNPERWTDKLVELYHKRNEFAAVSENARTFVHQHFNADRNIDLYERTFSDLVHGTGLPRKAGQTETDERTGTEDAESFCRVFGITQGDLATNPGFVQNMRFLKFMNRIAWKVLEHRERDLRDLKASYAYRIGNGIVDPVRRFIRFLKQLRSTSDTF